MIEFEWPLTDRLIDRLLTGPSFINPSKSSRFLCTSEKTINSIWQMGIKINDSHVEITLWLYNSKKTNYFLNDFEISLISARDKKYGDDKFYTWASSKNKQVFSMDANQSYCNKLFMCKKSLQYLQSLNHSFAVICQMKLQLIGFKINNVPIAVPAEFENLMSNTEFSDLVIEGPRKRYKVHKNILSTRSKVFNSMIKETMMEKKQNVITIDDFDDEVIEELIRYIYCGKVRREKLSQTLLDAADKYDVKGLKIICLEELFCKSLTIENACDILSLLHRYQANELRSQVIDFIVHNLQHICCNDFAEINDPKLLKRILFKTKDLYAHDDHNAN